MSADAVAAAEAVRRPTPGLPAATIEEAERVAAWLERPGVRLLECDDEWAWPLFGGVTVTDLPRHVLGEVSAVDVHHLGPLT